VSGFVNGDGSFYVSLFKHKSYKTGYVVQLRFNVSQDSRDTVLIEKLQQFFGCGSLWFNEKVISLTVTQFSQIIDVIIPIFLVTLYKELRE
jgi:hypothetical protein